MIKLILDGALFSECERLGNNRSGMMRIAEEITNLLINNPEIDISFANTVYLEYYHLWLKKYIQQRYPALAGKILSQKPSFLFNPLRFKSIYMRLPWLLFLPVKNKSINSYDLFHSFYYPFPKEIQNASIKKCITYLDIIPLKMDGYPKSLRNLTQRIVRSIESNYAISISEFSKQDLLDYNKNIDPNRVFVSPLAASRQLFFQNRSEEDWKLVKEKYNLPEQYFLCLASSDVRKNIPHLILSFSKFILQEKPKDLFLVLAGNSTHSRLILDKLNINKSVREKIIFTTKFIDEKELAVVYSRALSFFFMSIYEGFGLPVLEAMQCGTPTVSANCTSLPELVGDAGILLPPNDQDQLCQTMLNLYTNAQLRNSLSQKGLQRASQFTWEQAANEYANIFKKIMLS